MVNLILGDVSGSFIPCVGAVITDSRGRLLLIRRGHEPGAGLWSLPGGRIEPGETDAEALVREMREETGLEVEPGPLLGAVQRPGIG
ncbi:MAG TPA: NUDIX domain-containing protein, partial [Streptosporangiaceae bacterium]|nr:NUDIX domain-containing protein [Streptosporangiaceae bacterium]